MLEMGKWQRQTDAMVNDGTGLVDLMLDYSALDKCHMLSHSSIISCSALFNRMPIEANTSVTRPISTIATRPFSSGQQHTDT